MKQASICAGNLAISLTVLTTVNFGRIPGVLLQFEPEGEKRAEAGGTWIPLG